MHTTSLLSAAFPNGDRGGNSYRIRYNNKIANLHSVWDKGLGYFDGVQTPENAKSLATLFTSHYPEAYFGDKVNNLSPTDWAKEGFEVSKTSVYSTPLNQPTTKFYDENGRQVVEQRIALAGYRLAAVLNQLLQ